MSHAITCLFYERSRRHPIEATRSQDILGGENTCTNLRFKKQWKSPCVVVAFKGRSCYAMNSGSRHWISDELHPPRIFLRTTSQMNEIVNKFIYRKPSLRGIMTPSTVSGSVDGRCIQRWWRSVYSPQFEWLIHHATTGQGDCSTF